jgi:hypothetical protein
MGQPFFALQAGAVRRREAITKQRQVRDFIAQNLPLAVAVADSN